MGQKVTLDAPAQVIPPGRTVVPPRFVSENLGASADWFGEVQVVAVNEKYEWEQSRASFSGMRMPGSCLITQSGTGLPILLTGRPLFSVRLQRPKFLPRQRFVPQRWRPYSALPRPSARQHLLRSELSGSGPAPVR
ncbi:stalk domain-containing protein [Desulfovirgula thermocuniculi]|uniref:stalk domain-containing protein n=1 Tax=Desulfovirgula thermocuniculi TaxID=348842 RepID=UPI003CCB7ABF